MDYDVAKAIERIEDELIYSIMRNLKRHRAEETKEGFNWEMWQVKQLQSLNKFKKDNLKYKPKFAKLNKQIEELLIDMATYGSLDQEKVILEAIKKGYKPPKRSSNKLDATFFKYNSKKLEALISETSKNMAKAETAILRMAHDKYRSIIFDAQMYAATGAGTYEKAVDMATRDFLSAGINCVEYSNGARHTLSNYARMAIRTASKRAYLQGEGEQRKEWGIHTVIVNKRGNPCPKCLPFVGKVLIDDVWSGGSKKDGDYMLMSSAIAAGLYHPNCKDSHTTYFEGLTTRGASFTKKEIETIKQDYLEEQKQLYAQNQAKKYQRLADNSLDEENRQKYEKKTVAKSFEISKINITDITDNNINAIHYYMSAKSYIVNEKLRNNIELSDIEQEFIREFDDALKKLPKYNGNLQRSVYFNSDDDITEFLKDYTIGEPVTYKGYISTTKGETYNPDGQVQIYIEDAKNGVDISTYNKAEDEVLYDRNSTFKVSNIVEKDGKHYILLEEKEDE